MADPTGDGLSMRQFDALRRQKPPRGGFSFSSRRVLADPVRAACVQRPACGVRSASRSITGARAPASIRRRTAASISSACCT